MEGLLPAHAQVLARLHSALNAARSARVLGASDASRVQASMSELKAQAQALARCLAQQEELTGMPARDLLRDRAVRRGRSGTSSRRGASGSEASEHAARTESRATANRRTQQQQQQKKKKEQEQEEDTHKEQQQQQAAPVEQVCSKTRQRQLDQLSALLDSGTGGIAESNAAPFLDGMAAARFLTVRRRHLAALRATATSVLQRLDRARLVECLAEWLVDGEAEGHATFLRELLETVCCLKMAPSHTRNHALVAGVERLSRKRGHWPAVAAAAEAAQAHLASSEAADKPSGGGPDTPRAATTQPAAAQAPKKVVEAGGAPAAKSGADRGLEAKAAAEGASVRAERAAGRQDKQQAEATVPAKAPAKMATKVPAKVATKVAVPPAGKERAIAATAAKGGKASPRKGAASPRKGPRGNRSAPDASRAATVGAPGRDGRPGAVQLLSFPPDMGTQPLQQRRQLPGIPHHEERPLSTDAILKRRRIAQLLGRDPGAAQSPRTPAAAAGASPSLAVRPREGAGEDQPPAKRQALLTPTQVGGTQQQQHQQAVEEEEEPPVPSAFVLQRFCVDPLPLPPSATGPGALAVWGGPSSMLGTVTRFNTAVGRWRERRDQGAAEDARRLAAAARAVASGSNPRIPWRTPPAVPPSEFAPRYAPDPTTGEPIEVVQGIAAGEDSLVNAARSAAAAAAAGRPPPVLPQVSPSTASVPWEPTEDAWDSAAGLWLAGVRLPNHLPVPPTANDLARHCQNRRKPPPSREQLSDLAQHSLQLERWLQELPQQQGPQQQQQQQQQQVQAPLPPPPHHHQQQQQFSQQHPHNHQQRQQQQQQYNTGGGPMSLPPNPFRAL